MSNNQIDTHLASRYWSHINVTLTSQSYLALMVNSWPSICFEHWLPALTAAAGSVRAKLNVGRRRASGDVARARSLAAAGARRASPRDPRSPSRAADSTPLIVRAGCRRHATFYALPHAPFCCAAKTQLDKPPTLTKNVTLVFFEPRALPRELDYKSDHARNAMFLKYKYKFTACLCWKCQCRGRSLGSGPVQLAPRAGSISAKDEA